MGTRIDRPGSERSRSQELCRRDFFVTIGAGSAALLSGCLHALRPSPIRRKPNIIIIVADDLGYADTGVYGCKDIPTPSIDSLARKGARFTDAYVSCPVCSPSRAGLMTGRYQQRFGHWYNPGHPSQVSPRFGLPLSETTLADVLKEAGYVTCAVGKWHLGLREEFHPMKRGFDEFFGFLHGSHSYANPRADNLNPVLRGTQPVVQEEYLTHAFTREAVDCIERHHGGPFFLYLSYNAVHTPMQAPKEYLDRFGHITDTKRRVYAAMLAAMDDGIGAVLDTLRRTGIEDDTLVFFLSDNGGPPRANGSNNAPLRGAKGTILEGGIRVPFLIQWPRRIPSGVVYEFPVIALDVFPTSAAASGSPLPPGVALDGVDLVPYLAGARRGAPHDALFWKRDGGGAVRKDNWKLLKPDNGLAQLYNLSTDVGESVDVALDHPELAAGLAGALADWESQLKPPLWDRPRRKARKARKKRAS